MCWLGFLIGVLSTFALSTVVSLWALRQGLHQPPDLEEWPSPNRPGNDNWKPQGWQ